MANADLGKMEAETGKPVPQHTEHAAYTPNMQLIEAAVAASDEEVLLPRKELFRRYAPGVAFSMLLSLALVMEGMDVGLINNFFAQDAYKKKFGVYQGVDEKTGKDVYTIAASWQGNVGVANNCGSIIGLLLNGFLQARYGSRKVYMGAMVLMAGTIFVLFFATSIEMILVGNIVCGIPWGIFQTLTTAYAAEICPTALRGYLTAWVSMCWGAGSFLAAGVLRGSLQLKGDAGWRVPYGLQWIWIPPLFLVAFFCPESPWYLIRRGKIAEAEKSLRRLARKGHYTEQSMAETLALMQHTNEMEKRDAAHASFMDCFRGTNLRRTGIVCMAWVIQILNGQSITNYAAQMLTSIGMSQTDSFSYSMGIQSVNIFATAIAIALMGRVGRRPFYLFGSAGIGFAMLITGILGFAMDRKKSAIPVAVFLIIVQFIFKVSLGPTTYVVVAETASNRVRAQTIVLGRAVYVTGVIIVQQLNPRFLGNSKDAWNLGAKTGMFYFVLCFFWVVWIWFFLPETKNRSYADLDYLFQKKVNARKFSTTPVDLFEFTAPGGNKTIDEDDRVGTPVREIHEEKRAL